MDSLSKKQAKQFSKGSKTLADGKSPWKVGVLIDSTTQKRSSLHSENVKKFNHGKGYVIGHQWTNVVLVIEDWIIPLTPIPFHSKTYCKKQGIEYQTENQRVKEYIEKLDLAKYIGSHDPKKVLVLADSGYDDKKIEKAILNKKWTFIIALTKKRGVKSEKESLRTRKSEGWASVADFFKKYRRAKWQTVRVTTNH